MLSCVGIEEICLLALLFMIELFLSPASSGLLVLLLIILILLYWLLDDADRAWALPEIEDYFLECRF